MIDALREILETANRHRVRALATSFGVFWGVLMLTLLLAGGRGLRNGINQLFEADAYDAVWITTWRTTVAFEGLGAGRPIHLTVDDVEAIERGVPEVSSVSPRRRLNAPSNVSHGTRTVVAPVYGVGTGYLSADRSKLRLGRTLNELDVERSRKVAFIGSSTRRLLFGETAAVGRAIAIDGIEFLVVGEFSDPRGDDAHRIFVPYSTLAKVFDASGGVDVITASVRSGVESGMVRERILRLLARRHRFDPADAGAINLWFPEEERRKVYQVLRGIDLAVLVVGLGTLLSGMVGVSNILFVSVRERTKEFALRRALGATARSVLAMVMSEAVFLAGVSGFLGLLCATSLVRFARDMEVRSDYFRDPSVDPWTALVSVSLLIVSALIAGFFPAREAARMHPIDALRRE